MRALSLAVLLLAAACALRAQEEAAPDIGQLPGGKSPAVLLPGDRNPFARRETQVAATEDAESEESRLRALIESMPVTGVIRGSGTTKVLLSGLILKPGQPLPPLLDGQTEHLIVKDITDKQVEIDFVENDEKTEPRKIMIPVDMHPRVSISPAPLPVPPEPGGSPTSARASSR